MLMSEYIERVLSIRRAVNQLCDDLGAIYSTHPQYMLKVINDVANGDLSTDNGFSVDMSEPVIGGKKQLFKLAEV